MSQEREGCIRWVWGYGRGGARVTRAEAILFRICSGCGDFHPDSRAMRAAPCWPPAPLPGRTERDVLGFVSCEFAPEDDEGGVANAS